MRKNLILILLLLFITGCKNELVCTLETEEEGYLSKQEIIFSIADGKVEKAVTNYTMTFETNETAESYLNVFKSANKDYEIILDENKLLIISEKNYEEYNQTKEELKLDFEKNGYSCK